MLRTAFRRGRSCLQAAAGNQRFFPGLPKRLHRQGPLGATMDPKRIAGALMERGGAEVFNALSNEF
jgi:hypothetical protein